MNVKETTIKVLLLITLVIHSYMSGVKANDVWSFMDGPYFAIVHALAIDPQHPDTLYAGAVEAGGGLYKTADGGKHWEYLPPSQSTYAVAVDPQNPQRVYASKSRSTDGGETWDYMEDLGIWDSWSLAVDPINTNIVYAGDMLNNGIWKSTDYGENWEAINNGIPTGFPHGSFVSIGMNPVNPKKLIIGVFLDGLFRTYNGGESWDYIGFEGNVGIGDIMFDWSDTTIVYACVNGQLLQSIDAGDNWFTTGLTGVDVLTIDPIEHQTIYAGGDGVHKSSDAGSTWTYIGNGLSWRSKDVTAIAVNTTDNSKAYIGTQIGVYKSYDESYQWVQHFDGLSRTPVFDFSISGGLLYTAAGFGVFYYDYGEWLYKGLYYPLTVETNPEETSIILASTDTDFMQELLYRSIDHGYTWVLTGLQTPGQIPINIAPSDPGRVYASRWRSDDMGENWDTMSTEISDYGPIAIHPELSETIYMGSWGGGVYKSENGGTSWDTLGFIDVGSRYKVVTVDPQNGEIIYAGIEGEGMYKSTNGGEDWTVINTGLTNLEITALGVHPVDTQHLYIGTYGGGVFHTDNGGLEWEANNEGLPSLNVASIAVDTHTVYAGFYDFESVYQREFVVSTKDDKKDLIPSTFTVFPNYPNPFNKETVVRFSIPRVGYVEIGIFNIIGEQIRTLTGKVMNHDYHSVSWDGKDINGTMVSSGVYFVRIKYGSEVRITKINLIR